MGVAVQIERHAQRCGQVVFEDPRFGVFDDARSGVFCHPCRQDPFAVGERHSPAATDPAQLQPQRFGEQHAERQPQRGAFGVASVVVADTVAHRLTARRTTVARRVPGEIPTYSNVCPWRVSHAYVGTSGGISSNQNPYAPGTAGMHDGEPSTSVADHIG